MPDDSVILTKPGVRERFLEALSKGCSYTLASDYAGFSYQTLRVYLKKARKIRHLSDEEVKNHPDKFYLDFYREVRSTSSAAALGWLKKIDDAMYEQWQAAG